MLAWSFFDIPLHAASWAYEIYFYVSDPHGVVIFSFELMLIIVLFVSYKEGTVSHCTAMTVFIDKTLVIFYWLHILTDCACRVVFCLPTHADVHLYSCRRHALSNNKPPPLAQPRKFNQQRSRKCNCRHISLVPMACSHLAVQRAMNDRKNNEIMRWKCKHVVHVFNGNNFLIINASPKGREHVNGVAPAQLTRTHSIPCQFSN